MLDQLRSAATPLLAVLPRAAWIPHALVRKADGKLDKPPRGGCTTNTPSSWFDLDRALEYTAGQNDAVGIGFAVTDGVIGLDFDNCRDPITGVIDDDVQFEIERCDSFTYVTPSGRGVRVIGANDAKISGGKRNRYLPSGRKIEVFVGPTNHFNTFTSDVLPGYDTIRDISDATLDYISGLPGNGAAEQSAGISAEPERSIEAIRSALRAIPNEKQDWDHYVRIGMAVFRASGGSAEGHEAWRDWSARHACHDDNECDARWARFRVSPPTRIGFGTLYHMAREANPLWVVPLDGADYGSIIAAIEPPKESPSGGAAHNADSVFQTLGIEDLLSLPPVEWLIDGILTTDGFGVTYGPPASLKSFLVLGWALSICAGRPWFGRSVRQGGVLYVAGEGVRGMGRRVRAWMKHNDLEGVDLPFRLLPTSVNLADPEQVAKLILTAKAAAALEGVDVAFVVIDTVARSIPGADENSAQDMGRFVAAIEQIRTAVGVHVHGVHHSGKDAEKGARGSTALLGGVDTMIMVKREEDRLTVKIEKQKDEDEGEPVHLVTRKVEMLSGLRAESSLVLVLNHEPPVAQHSDPTARFLNEVAGIVGPDRRMPQAQLVAALGGTRSHQYAALNEVIPLAPNAVDIVLNDQPVRLWRTRTGTAANAPIEVVCHVMR